ncbi:HD domain-containing protein [Facklamia hominis]|uniref:HD domain-containing protein n=1 Tax=Facklamia hominis TaxID=178214 RepID=UPI0029D41224|nr:HD domain-containing protein [Facklamia hominis]WPJ90408.1 HD domain-containing protein [Facklamia hominis]
MDQRLQKQLEFCLKLDEAKNILRQTHLSQHGRRENDAEHAWHMAVMAYVLRDYANEPVDVGKLLIMCLIHDIVEIEAGDTYAYDEAGKKTQAEREAAAWDKLFGMLPADQAAELAGLFDEFDEGKSPEARFANAMDNLQPLILNHSNGGKDWIDHQVTYDQVFQRQSRTEAGSKVLFDYTQQVLDDHVKKGNLRK